jgi:hypothetical protein
LLLPDAGDFQPSLLILLGGLQEGGRGKERESDLQVFSHVLLSQARAALALSARPPFFDLLDVALVNAKVLSDFLLFLPFASMA